jgi:hypothetical protein
MLKAAWWLTWMFCGGKPFLQVMSSGWTETAMAEKGKFAKWWRLNYHFVAWLCLLAGVMSVIFGSFSVLYDGEDAPFGMDFISSIGPWGYWAILFGILGLLAGGFYTYDHIAQIRKFDRMMEGRGRSNFIKDLDEIERLAYILGPSFEVRVIERKREFRLK